MTRRVTGRRLVSTVLAAGLVGAIALAAPAEAKKKSGGTLDITQAVNAQVPDRGPGFSPVGLLSSTIDVGNKFKGKRVRDVNVTVQATGTSGPSAADNMVVQLTAPNGASSILFGGLAGNSVGPLTLDDESPFDITVFPGVDPTALGPPYQGTAQPGDGRLFVMDDGRVTGTWTLRALDQNTDETYVLNFWRLNVIAGKPYRTK